MAVKRKKDDEILTKPGCAAAKSSPEDDL